MRRAYQRFSAWWNRHRILDDEGQAAIESALVLPLMTFLVLGTIQLTMMQQARLMNEYAAFQACRAGIVWNANRDRMRQAATVALLPTFGRTDNAFQFGLTWAKFETANQLTDFLSEALGFIPGGIADAVRVIDVDIMHPTEEEFDLAGPLGGGGGGGGPGGELDFDLVEDDEERNKLARIANRLQVRVTYLYMMKIPFANWIIHDAWMAQRAGIRYTGPIDAPMEPGDPAHWRPSEDGGEGRNRGRVYTLAVAREGMSFDFERTARLGAVALLATQADLYFIPLESHYSMRMQSNVYRSNLQY